MTFFSWTEKWFRRWRGVYCDHFSLTGAAGLDILTGRCREALRDFRLASCRQQTAGADNAKPVSVMQELRTNLECDAFSAADAPAAASFAFLASIATVLLQ